MSRNENNNLSRFGHVHPPRLEIVTESPVEPSAERIDWPRVGVYSILGGLCVGILGERAALMFEFSEDSNLIVGIGSGTVMALAVAVYGIKNFRKT